MAFQFQKGPEELNLRNNRSSKRMTDDNKTDIGGSYKLAT